MAEVETKLKEWLVEDTNDGETRIFTAPTTGATITADRRHVFPEGNFRNLNSDQANELIPMLREALAFSSEAKHAWDEEHKPAPKVSPVVAVQDVSGTPAKK